MRIAHCIALALAGLAYDSHAWEGDAFRVCADPNNPPYSTKSQAGFENKIGAVFAKSIGKKIAYEWFPQRMGFVRNTLKALREGSEDDYKCDVILGVPAGYELAATTKPYYRSTYALIFRTKHGLDDIKSPADLERLPADRKAHLRIAMFDGSPATTWLLKHNLIESGIPYQSMTADANVNVAQTLETDFKKNKLDVAIVWGPIAGYLQQKGKPGDWTLLPMASEEGIRFDFSIAMAVRFPDKARKEELNALIDKHHSEIEAILRSAHVPLLPLEAPKSKDDDDD